MVTIKPSMQYWHFLRWAKKKHKYTITKYANTLEFRRWKCHAQCSAFTGSRLDRTDDTFVLENYLFIDFNKKYNHSALRFCVFLYITEWPWSNFLYATPLEFRRWAKTCHKNNERNKKLTLHNEIYWRKITYLYVGFSTKISICIFQLYLTIFESSFF